MASAALSGFLRPAGFDPHEDPRPRPASTRRRLRQAVDAPAGPAESLWVYLCGLVFLLFAVDSILEGDPSRAVLSPGRGDRRIAVAYVLTAWMVDMSIRARWAYVVGFVALVAAPRPSGAGRSSTTASTWRS